VIPNWDRIGSGFLIFARTEAALVRSITSYRESYVVFRSPPVISVTPAPSNSPLHQLSVTEARVQAIRQSPRPERTGDTDSDSDPDFQISTLLRELL
jgi:hypothetical protein